MGSASELEYQAKLSIRLNMSSEELLNDLIGKITSVKTNARQADGYSAFVTGVPQGAESTHPESESRSDKAPRQRGA